MKSKKKLLWIVGFIAILIILNLRPGGERSAGDSIEESGDLAFQHLEQSMEISLAV